MIDFQGEKEQPISLSRPPMAQALEPTSRPTLVLNPNTNQRCSTGNQLFVTMRTSAAPKLCTTAPQVGPSVSASNILHTRCVFLSIYYVGYACTTVICRALLLCRLHVLVCITVVEPIEPILLTVQCVLFFNHIPFFFLPVARYFIQFPARRGYRKAGVIDY